MSDLRIPIPKISFNPPVYYCKKTVLPFELDGNLEKPFWEDAPYTDYFQDIEGGDMPKPRFHTRAKMLWDEKNLYFGAVLEGDEIWGTLTERESVIFQDNDFEIFVDPDSDTHQYYEFEMNAKNTVWDLLLTKPYRDFGGKPINGWDIKGLQTAVHIDGKLNNPGLHNKRWMVEVVMPFASLMETAAQCRAPIAGEFYRVNFSRVQWKTEVKDGGYKKCIDPTTGMVYPEDNWVWSPTGLINIHYPELWGFVFFTDQGEEYPIPEDEITKWELRKLYYKEHQYFDKFGRFTEDLTQLDDGNLCIAQVKIEITRHTFEISCISSDQKREITIQGDGKTSVYKVNKEV